jgi:hypothetical protein
MRTLSGSMTVRRQAVSVREHRSQWSETGSGAELVAATASLAHGRTISISKLGKERM